MSRICYTVIVVVAFLKSAEAQRPVENEESTCNYTEIYKREGWPIPGIKGAKKKTLGTPVRENSAVVMTELEPSTRTATIQSFTCSREYPGRLEVQNRTVAITEIRSFEVRGRIFAYNLMYGIDGIAAQWSLRFYDLDGSGRFTLRRSEINRFQPEMVPDWVSREEPPNP